MFAVFREIANGSGALAVVSQDELILQRSEWKRNGKRVVCVTGIFDLLHPGHIRLLEQARALGDILAVAIQSDAYARQLKGPGRPVTPARERAEIIAGLSAVDVVVELTDETEAGKFMEEFAPDILVQGSRANSGKHADVGRNPASAFGANVTQIPLEPGHSTSRLIERIKQLRA